MNYLKTEKPLRMKRLRHFIKIVIEKKSLLIFLFKIVDFAVYIV